MAEDGIALKRVFDVPRERVWREWTEPERFADWFGGSEADVPVSSVSMDVREGGAWRATMFFGPDRREIQWTGEYREVVPPERLALTFCNEPGDESELVIVELIDLGDGRTEMRFQQRGHLTAAQYKETGDGWSTFFDRLAERLAAA
jgi:uncharacterized protein YndB with AHSA1/START domain